MLRRGLWVVSLALAICAGDVLAQQPNPSFNLVNRTGRIIERAYTSPSGDNSWGQDRLGQNRLSADRSLPIRLPADGNCLYDVRIEYQGGGSDERRRVNTCNIVDVIFGPDGAGGSDGTTQASGDPSFRLVNRSGRVIERAYASPSGDDRWGSDRLGRNMLPAGRVLTIRLPSDGNCLYDVRVEYQGGGSDEQRRVNTCNRNEVAFGSASGGSASGGSAQAASEDPSFRLVNRSGRMIERAYASPSGDDSWGQDRLGENMLPSGRFLTIRLPTDGNCLYDVRVEYQGGGSDEQRRVNTCNRTEVAFGASSDGSGQAANNPSFRLVNRTGRTIERAYASPTGDDSWGRDRLGEERLPSGRYLAIRLPADGNCLYDVRIEYQGGGSAERRRVNTCNVADVTFQ